MKNLKLFTLAILLFCLLGPGLTWGEAPYVNTRLVTVQITAEDAGSGVAKIEFSDDGETWSELDAFTVEGQTEVSIEGQIEVSEGDGKKEIWVRFQDRAGNWSEPIKVDLVLDETPPTGTLKCLW